jgi:hypothetical protein
MLNVPLFTKLMKIAIFEMVVNTSELAKEFVSPKLLIFRKNQVDAKMISNALWNGRGNMKPCFQLLAFKLDKY